VTREIWALAGRREALAPFWLIDRSIYWLIAVLWTS
jgi:hypothetical protein